MGTGRGRDSGRGRVLWGPLRHGSGSGLQRPGDGGGGGRVCVGGHGRGHRQGHIGLSQGVRGRGYLGAMDASQEVLELGPRRGSYVAVAGPIGVGKTTMGELVARRMGALLVREVFAENPYLDDFYAGRSVRLQTELSFMMARYNQAREIDKLLALGNNVVTDWTFPQVLVYSRVTLQDDPRDWLLYKELYDRLLVQVPAPDRLVCLDAELPVLMDRIRGRGRGYESAISPDYLLSLREGYTAWRQEPPYPLVWLDTTDLPIPSSEVAQEAALNALWDSLGCCPLLLPEPKLDL